MDASATPSLNLRLAGRHVWSVWQLQLAAPPNTSVPIQVDAVGKMQNHANQVATWWPYGGGGSGRRVFVDRVRGVRGMCVRSE